MGWITRSLRFDRELFLICFLLSFNLIDSTCSLRFIVIIMILYDIQLLPKRNVVCMNLAIYYFLYYLKIDLTLDLQY